MNAWPPSPREKLEAAVRELIPAPRVDEVLELLDDLLADERQQMVWEMDELDQ